MQLFALFAVDDVQWHEVELGFLNRQRNHAFGLERQGGFQIVQRHVGKVRLAKHHASDGVDESRVLAGEFESLHQCVQQSGHHIMVDHFAIHYGSVRQRDRLEMLDGGQIRIRVCYDRRTDGVVRDRQRRY